MTGVYIRVYRDGKWLNLEIEDLTDDERQKVLNEKEKFELIKWINMLCHTIKELS